ncbi:hypothetical protein SAMN02799622_04555 [Methylobacterium sp. UNC378MF]|jgi:hypothetical protein|uniref:hypothetical protein n=1 Tax=unclassified Methylobacterium TaxID=2615210 RepID=UPI000881B6C3|nr:MULTISPECIES: hypothetical protein [unclassified Methylobacterium]SDA29655.1 hypothetical protein SAMN02799622_04555 [Methylobacterium sp. UNC378MF]
MPSCPARSRRSWPRFALLAAMTLVGLATVPTEGADRHLERPKPRIALQAAERWRLRPTEPAVVTMTGSIRQRPETAIPEERRNVRLVYPALIEAR